MSSGSALSLLPAFGLLRGLPRDSITLRVRRESSVCLVELVACGGVYSSSPSLSTTPQESLSWGLACGRVDVRAGVLSLTMAVVLAHQGQSCAQRVAEVQCCLLFFQISNLIWQCCNILLAFRWARYMERCRTIARMDKGNPSPLGLSRSVIEDCGTVKWKGSERL